MTVRKRQIKRETRRQKERETLTYADTRRGLYRGTRRQVQAQRPESGVKMRHQGQKWVTQFLVAA